MYDVAEPGPLSLAECRKTLVTAVIPIPQSRERNLALEAKQLGDSQLRLE
jgi:hypothetical protein